MEIPLEVLSRKHFMAMFLMRSLRSSTVAGIPSAVDGFGGSASVGVGSGLGSGFGLASGLAGSPVGSILGLSGMGSVSVGSSCGGLSAGGSALVSFVFFPLGFGLSGAASMG